MGVGTIKTQPLFLQEPLCWKISDGSDALPGLLSGNANSGEDTNYACVCLTLHFCSCPLGIVHSRV